MHSFMNFLFPRVYNKATYTYSSFSFDELLAVVQQFLVKFEITLPNQGACEKQKIHDLCLAHMGKLWSTIHSV